MCTEQLKKIWRKLNEDYKMVQLLTHRGEFEETWTAQGLASYRDLKWSNYYCMCKRATARGIRGHGLISSPLASVLLLPFPSSSMPSSIAAMINRSKSHNVNFFLGRPVKKGRSVREALTLPTATRHCCALIGIWGVWVLYVYTCACVDNVYQGFILNSAESL